MARASAVIGTDHYATKIKTGHHAFVSDEPPANGGGDVGPDPYELLCAALVACTSITLRMYADRKQWPVTSIAVSAHFSRADKTESIQRMLKLEGSLSDEQRQRMAEIAERTPVTLTLKKGLPIVTTLEPA